MVTQINQSKRRQLLRKILGEVCADLGFKAHSGAYFTRTRGSLQDVFFYQETRTNGQYDITYGIDCPQLLQDLRASEILSPSKLPKLLINPGTGGRLGNGKSFVCKYEEHIHSSSVKMKSTMLSESVPWWESFTTETEVIEHYRKVEVRANEPSEELHPGAILRWTLYGLLLYDSGNQAIADIWLRRSLQAWMQQDKPTESSKEWIRLIETRIP